MPQSSHWSRDDILTSHAVAVVLKLVTLAHLWTWYKWIKLCIHVWILPQAWFICSSMWDLSISLHVSVFWPFFLMLCIMPLCKCITLWKNIYIWCVCTYVYTHSLLLIDFWVGSSLGLYEWSRYVYFVCLLVGTWLISLGYGIPKCNCWIIA